MVKDSMRSDWIGDVIFKENVFVFNSDDIWMALQCFACEIGIQISWNVVCSCSVWRCPSVSQRILEPLNLDWTLTLNIERPTLSAQTLKVCQQLLHHSTLNTSPAQCQATLVPLGFSSCEAAKDPNAVHCKVAFHLRGLENYPDFNGSQRRYVLKVFHGVHVPILKFSF